MTNEQIEKEAKARYPEWQSKQYDAARVDAWINGFYRAWTKRDKEVEELKTELRILRRRFNVPPKNLAGMP